MKYLIEYIWIGGKSELRSKNRIIDLPANHSISLDNIPIWNFDGSSTGQADVKSSERFLKPVYMCNNPFCTTISSLLVLCAVYDDINLNTPSLNNNYHFAKEVLEKYRHTAPWFGFEQEFFLFKRKDTNIDLTPPGIGTMYLVNAQGQYYCGVGAQNSFGREIMDSFINNCLLAELSLYGTNAEVAPGQWEFQIGTVEGIEASHQLWVARYILTRVGESFDVCISLETKPFTHMNGSGLHTNFSNNLTRCPNGFENMKKMFVLLDTTHKEHIDNYGKDNDKRLTGTHETSNINNFSWSVGGRDCSVRVGSDVEKNGGGYFEDRRPASNCDPYLVSMLLVKNTAEI